MGVGKRPGGGVEVDQGTAGLLRQIRGGGRGATPMLALAQFVRGRGAVAHQRYAEGLDHLRRVLDPADPAYHPFIGAWGSQT